MNKLAIVGAGIQGLTLAFRLIEKGFRDFVLIDPRKPLDNWKYMTGRTGMGYLRSPGSHHPGPKHNSLFSYCPIDPEADRKLYYPPYFRPDLKLFNRYCDDLLKEHNITKHIIKAEVKELDFKRSFELITQNDIIKAEKVVLAQGWTELNIPYPEVHDRSCHIFSPYYKTLSLSKGTRILILGAGLSAVQKALSLDELGYDVTLASRRKIKAHLFDSDPCLIGPKCGSEFKLLPEDTEMRREFITEHSFPGTVPFDFFYKIRNAIGLKKIRHIIEPHLKIDDKGVFFECGGKVFDILIQATGFKKVHSKLLTEFTQKKQISLYNALPDNNLQFFPGLFVMGFSASLRLGGFAPNIIGGRKSAEIIAEAIINGS